jgi:branched-chain amino acid transport system permease protein
VSAREEVGRLAPLLAFLRRHGGLLALTVVVMTVPAYVGDRYYLSILAQLAWRFMTCVGLSLLVGQAGQISLGQAGFVAIGAYGAAILTTRAGLDPWLAMVVAASLAAAVAVLVGIPTLRLRGYYLAMATLGINEIIGVLLVQLKGLTLGTGGIGGIPSLSVADVDLGSPRIYHLVVWGVALLVFLMALNISRSRAGRSLRAIRQSEMAAEALGVGTSFRKVQVFTLAAVCASVAGSFEAYYSPYHIWPSSYGIDLSILLIAGVIIGGLRSIWGALWGAVVVVVLLELLKRLGFEDYKMLVFGLLLVGIMVLSQGSAKRLRQRARDFMRRYTPGNVRNGE